MRQMLAATRPLVEWSWREVVFDLSEAKRALPYVARIARDAANAYRQVQQCRAALCGGLPAQQRAMVDEHRESALRKLNAAIDECNAVGADLMDIRAGVVRFSAAIDGRPVSLVWRIDEPIEPAWNDLLHGR